MSRSPATARSIWGGQTVTVGDVTLVSGSIANGTLIGATQNVQSGTVTATLQSTTGLTKTGTGTTTLSVANTYTGGTVVTDGQLIVDADNALPAGGALVIGANGTVKLSSSLTKAVKVSRLTLIVSSQTAAPTGTSSAASQSPATLVSTSAATAPVVETAVAATVSQPLVSSLAVVESAAPAVATPIATVLAAQPACIVTGAVSAPLAAPSFAGRMQLPGLLMQAHDAAVQQVKYQPTASELTWLGYQANSERIRRPVKKQDATVKAIDAVLALL